MTDQKEKPKVSPEPNTWDLVKHMSVANQIPFLCGLIDGLMKEIKSKS